MFVDSHAHVFDERINFEMIDLSNIDAIIVPSYSASNLQNALDCCSKNSKFHCMLGIYPEFASQVNASLVNFIREHSLQICGIGEIGLDETFLTPYKTQIFALETQLSLAQNLNLPASIHLHTKRDFETFFSIIQDYSVRCALHCFNGDLKDCETAINLGLFISFAGNITYKGRADLRSIAKIVPDENLLIETDSPSMLPSVFMRKGINTPNNIIYVAQKLAEVRGESVEYIAEITKNNAVKLFNIKV